MKKPEWIFVVVIVLVSSYFVFNYFTKKNAFKTWDLVPESAVVVYETKSVIDIWNKLVESDVWVSLRNVEEFKQINENLQLLDTLSGGGGQLASVLNKQNLLISSHVTSQNSFGFTYFVSLGTVGHTIFLNLLANAEKEFGLKKSQRVYQAQTIYELELKNSKLSYIVHKNTLVLSTDGFLVEDVVRNIQNGYKSNFIKTYPMLSGNPSFASDEGNLYVNGKDLPLFADSFLSIKERNKTTYSLATAFFFDLAVSNKGILASGFSFAEKENSLTTAFKDQQAVPLGLMNLIPSNAATMEHFGSSNLNLWYANWVNLVQSKSKSATLDAEGGKRFVDFIKDEMALITLPSVSKETPNKLYIAELSDKPGMYNLLNKLAEKKVENTNDSLYVEIYAEHEIRLIEQEPLLQSYFGDGFNGFSSTYYLVYNNFLVIANTAELLRNWQVQIEKDQTWGKSVQMNTFFKDMLSEANYTYVTNLEYSWNLLVENLNSQNKDWVNTNAATIKNFGLVAFQLSNLDNRYYASLNVKYNPRVKTEAGNAVMEVANIQMANTVVTKPQVVKNHKNGTWEILVQDSLKVLMLLDPTGEIQWEKELDNTIRGKVYQIDYYKNNKLQYLLHTDSMLYLIDRNGNKVDNYPKYVDYKINNLHVLDYDRSKNYRILISDYFGNLRMYDKGGNLLDGWNPNDFSTTLSDNIFHVRVRGKDRILIPLNKGLVHLTNRRGEDENGFPLDLGIELSNEIYFKSGDNFGDSYFTTVSNEGLVVRFTMTGKMLSRNQLFKESDESEFELVSEKQGKDYVFVRNDLNRLAILSSDGTLLFEKDYEGTSKRKVQYYNFGADKKLFTVTNNSDVYLYNQFGKLLHSSPITSHFPVSIVYFRNINTCQIYIAHNNTVEVKKIIL